MRNYVLTLAFVAFFTPALSAQNAARSEGPLKLSLKRAIEIALIPEGNTQIQLGAAEIELAKARASRVRADLMPEFAGDASVKNLARNLSTIGLPSGLELGGFRIPDFSGAYSLIDARLTVNQNVLDLSLRERVKASRNSVGVAEAQQEDTKDEIAARVAKFYLWASRTEATAATARANLALAETLLKLAQDRQDAGTGLAVETARAEVQIANARQQVFLADSERTRALLVLLDAMNVDLDTPLELTDGLALPQIATADLERAMTDALAHRSDYSAQVRREENAKTTRRASELERLPSIEGMADYGSAGSGFTNMRPTHTVGVSVKIPFIDGGRRKSELAEKSVAIRQEEIRTQDLRRRIELDTKIAIGNVRAAELQISVARQGLTVAEAELGHARARYEEGVANSIETTDAQNRLERARDNYTTALYNINAAHVDFLEATGRIRELIK